MPVASIAAASQEEPSDQFGYTEPYMLYGEDNTTDSLLFERAFRVHEPNFPLVHRGNGKLIRDFLEARVQNGERLPSLVVLDIKMPGHTGLEVLEYIRKNVALSRLPVVILSASSEHRDIQTAYKYRVNAYITKPNRYGQLKALVGTLATFWISYNHPPL